MKRALAAFCVALAAVAFPVAGEEPQNAPAPSDEPKSVTESPTADLIEAARRAKERRKKSRAKVLTNEDVRKSKGKIIEGPPGEMTVVAPGPTSMQQHRDSLVATKAAEARAAAAEKRAEKLSRELAAVELSYYEEDDLDRRDSVIVARFTEVKRQLDEAKRELEEALAALERSEPEPEEPAGPPGS